VNLPETGSILRRLLIIISVVVGLTLVSLFMPAQRLSIEGIGLLSFETTVTLSVGYEVAYANPDSIAKVGTDTSGTGTSFTLSFSHTLVAGSDRMVAVSVGIENGNTVDVTSVTYGGVACTKAIEHITGIIDFRYLCEIWYILEADLPSDGSQTVQISASGTAYELEHNGYCAEYTGVNQGVPEATNGANTTSSPVTNTISPSTAAWVISVAGSGNTNTVPTQNEGQYQPFDYNDFSSRFSVAELRGASGETSLSTSFTGGINRLCRVAASWTEVPTAPTAAPTYQSFTVAESATNVTSIAVDKPAGTASGDLLIGVIVTDGTAGTFTPPASWTLIDSGTADPGGNANQVTLGAWHKIAGGSEPSSYTWSWTYPQTVYAFIIRITGHDVSDPIDVWGVATGSSTGASITVTSPDVTTTVDDTLVLRIFGADRAMNFGSYPAGHTGITFGSSSGDNTTMYQCTGGAAYIAQAAIGATGTADFSAIPNVSATEEWRALTVAIAPAAAAPPDISNAPGIYDFQTVQAGVNENTGTGYFNVTNNSTVNITVTIVCNGWTDTTDGTNPWIYGAPAANTAQLKASDGDGAYDVAVDDTTPATLHATSTPGDDFSWELQLDAPTSFTHGHSQQTTVTLTATSV